MQFENMPEETINTKNHIGIYAYNAAKNSGKRVLPIHLRKRLLIPFRMEQVFTDQWVCIWFDTEEEMYHYDFKNFVRMEFTETIHHN